MTCLTTNDRLPSYPNQQLNFKLVSTVHSIAPVKLMQYKFQDYPQQNAKDRLNIGKKSEIISLKNSKITQIPNLKQLIKNN